MKPLSPQDGCVCEVEDAGVDTIAVSSYRITAIGLRFSRRFGKRALKRSSSLMGTPTPLLDFYGNKTSISAHLKPPIKERRKTDPMKNFCRLFERLDSTTSTNAKVEALADYFSESDPGSAAWGLFFLTGRRL